MISCKSCCFFHYPSYVCQRFPEKVEKDDPEDWCGEYVRGPNRQEASKAQDEKNKRA
jgi:hypothetical protein